MARMPPGGDYGGGYLKVQRHLRSAVISAGFALFTVAPFTADLAVPSISQAQLTGYKYPVRTVRHTEFQTGWIYQSLPIVPIEKSSSDSLPTIVTESDAIAVVNVASDSLSAVALESGVVSVANVASDSLSTVVAESNTYSQLTVAVDETLSTAIAESATTAISVLSSESVTAGLAESSSVSATEAWNASQFQNIHGERTPTRAALKFRYPLASTGFSTDGSSPNVATSESLAIGFTESALAAVIDAWNESKFQNILTERTAKRRQYDPRYEHHKFSFGLVDARAVMPAIDQLANSERTAKRKGVLIVTPDSLGWLYEGSTAVTTKLSSDSLPMGLSETATTIAQSTSSDSLALSITEAASQLVHQFADESLGIGLNEAATIDTGVTLTPIATSESLVIGFAESASITAVNATATDDIAVQFTEQTLAVSTDNTSDSLTIQLAEQATVEDLTTGFSAKNASDALVAGLSEQTSGYSTGSSSDSMFGLEESAVIVVYAATTDSITVGLQDASNAVSVTLNVADTLPLGYVEAVLQHVFAVAADTLPIDSTEIASPFVLLTGSDSLPSVLSEALLIFNQFATQDSLAVIITETGSLFDAGDLIDKAGVENVRTSITENSVLFTRTTGTLSPLVATVECLSAKKRDVEVYGSLPHDAEVIAGV